MMGIDFEEVSSYSIFWRPYWLNLIFLLFVTETNVYLFLHELVLMLFGIL